MTVVMVVARTGRFLSLKLRNGQASNPATIMQVVSAETLSGMRLRASTKPRSSASVVTANTTAPRSPAQRRARRARTPRGGKGSPSFLPSASPLLSSASVAAWSASTASQLALPSASPVPWSVEGSSPEAAAPVWVPTPWLLGSVSG